MIRASGPLLKTVAAALCAFFAASAIHFEALSRSAFSLDLAFWFVLGGVYTQFFEFWVHRSPMHQGLRFLEDVRRNHLEHHRIFHGNNFRTGSESDLRHIAGRWWVFPLLFLVHYLPAVGLLPLERALSFLLGCVAHYVLFEISHWLTHVEGNAVDRFLASLPLLGSLRSFQIEHHRAHHEKPTFAFNFNPPYLGDRFSGMLSEPERVVAPVTPLAPALAPVGAPEPGLQARRRFLTQQLVRYGAAAALGVAALGLVVLVHGRAARVKRAREEAPSGAFPHTPSPPA